MTALKPLPLRAAYIGVNDSTPPSPAPLPHKAHWQCVALLFIA